MTRKVLFVHVPKTAGSTLKSFFKSTLDDFVVQANSPIQLAQGDSHVARVRGLDDIQRVMGAHGGLALHVDTNFDAVSQSTDYRSLANLLFERRHYRYFEQFTILTMFRRPFRRFMSEYAFVRRMKEADSEFLPDVDVTTVEEFLDRAHPNAILHFLLERDLYKPRTITTDDLERVKERIAAYPIHVGIHERFDESIAHFARVLGQQFQASDLPRLNASAEVSEVEPGLEAEFARRNQLDLELYEFAEGVFQART